MFSILQKDHPYLFLSDARLKDIKTQRKDDPFLDKLIYAVQQEADSLIDKQPTIFQIIGPRMLKNCQQILNRVITLAFIFRLTKEDKYKERVLKELESTANFPHWNKDHFLDTAELCTAFGIAYDWLYGALPGKEQSLIRNALLNKGLRIGLQEYENKAWWMEHRFNWNNVCHGGLSIGVLALADEEPELAEAILKTTIEKLPISLTNYGPDGAWQAGPEYWEYTTWYTALLIDAMQSVLHSDFDLSQTPGLDNTGFFPIYCEGPTGLYYNFADADTKCKAKPVLYWLGRHFNHPELVHENHRLLQRDLDRGQAVNPFNIIWYLPDSKIVPELPTYSYFKRLETILMRSVWNDPQALFVGFKGGLNRADHGHLDLGSFVLDFKGVRWIHDLGRDDYDLPGYWDRQEGGTRWNLYRLNNHSHNTLTLNDDLQRAQATASVVKTEFSQNESYAIVDLSEAYRPHAEKVLRGIALVHEESVVIRDEITWADKQKNVRWQIMTDAEITLQGPEAMLKKEGVTMVARIVSPDNAVFEIRSASPKPPEDQNTGFQQLTINYNETEKRTILCVALNPVSSDTQIKPLDAW